MKYLNKMLVFVLSVCMALSVAAFDVSTFAETASGADIERIEVSDITVIENTGGFRDGDDHYIYSKIPTFTVFKADGSQYPMTQDGNVFIDGNAYTISIDTSNQNAQNGYWTAGNTYSSTAELYMIKSGGQTVFLGITDTYNVTVTETPVKSLEISDVEVIENTCGYRNIDGSFVYCNYDPSYTIKMKNGDVYNVPEGVTGVDIDGTWAGLSYYNADSAMDGTWTVGNTYRVKGELYDFGVSAEFNVTIVESPVESFTVSNTEVIENTGGYYENDHFIYSAFNPDFRVKMKDGSEYYLSGDESELELPDGDVLSLSFEAVQNEEKGYWSVGNTYEVKAELFSGAPMGGFAKALGASATFSATVVPGPIESLEIDDISVTENTGGYVDEDGTYCYTHFTPGFRVKMRDGRVLAVSAGEYGITIDGEWYSLSIRSMEAGGYWTVGNTYEVRAELSGTGVEATFNVTVEPGPIESLVVEDLSIIEGTNGSVNENGKFIYNRLNPTFTVKFRNGDEFKGTGGVHVDGVYYSLNIEARQDDESGYWTAGNTYTIKASLLGAITTFKVTITESPAESLTIQDVEMIEGTRFYNISPVYSLKLKDGREYTGQGSIEVDGKWYSLSVDRNYEEEAANWKAGSTHTITGSILGVTSEFRVIVKESPIAKIEVPNISVIENTHGYERNGHFIYDLNYIRPAFTITMKDGRVIPTYDGEATIDNVCYELKLDINSDDIWTVGNTYRVKASVPGAECEFGITVISDPIRSFEVDNDTVYEHEMYVDDSGVLRYYPDAFRLPYRVTLNDGTVLKSESYKYPANVNSIGGRGGAEPVIYIGGLSYGFKGYDDDQDENPWGIGEHTAKAYFLSHEASFTVTVKESSIKSVEAEDMVFINGVDNISNIAPKYTVTFKDGTKKTYAENNRDPLTLNGNTLWFIKRNLYDKTLIPGKTYKATGTLGHLKCDFSVTVVENPVTGIELIKQPDKTEYVTEEYFDAKGAVVRIHFNDSTYEDISFTESSIGYPAPEYYCKKLGRYIQYHGEYLFNAGNTTMSISLFGESVSCAIKVKKNDWQSITAENNGKDAPVLTAASTSSGDAKLRITSLYILSEVPIEGGKILSANITTDGGVFKGYVYSYDDGTYSVEIAGKMAEIGKNEWITNAISAQQTAKGMMGDLNGDGKINATDALLALQLAVGKSGLDAEKQQLADVDNSGSVTATDALLILQLAVGKIDKF